MRAEKVFLSTLTFHRTKHPIIRERTLWWRFASFQAHSFPHTCWLSNSLHILAVPMDLSKRLNYSEEDRDKELLSEMEVRIFLGNSLQPSRLTDGFSSHILPQSLSKMQSSEEAAWVNYTQYWPLWNQAICSSCMLQFTESAGTYCLLSRNCHIMRNTGHN